MAAGVARKWRIPVCIFTNSPQKKRKSPHALIRDDPLAHVEATTRFLIPKNSAAAAATAATAATAAVVAPTKLNFITSTTKASLVVPIYNRTTSHRPTDRLHAVMLI